MNKKAELQRLRRFTLKRLTKSPPRDWRAWLKQPVDPEVAADLRAIRAIPSGKDQLDAFRAWREEELILYDVRRAAAEDARAAEWVQAGKPPQHVPPGWSEERYQKWVARGRGAWPRPIPKADCGNRDVSWPGRRPVIEPWPPTTWARWKQIDVLEDEPPFVDPLTNQVDGEWQTVMPRRKPVNWRARERLRLLFYLRWLLGARREQTEALWGVLYCLQRKTQPVVMLHYLRRFFGAWRDLWLRDVPAASVLRHEDACPAHEEKEPCGTCAKMRAPEWRRVSKMTAGMRNAAYQNVGYRGTAVRNAPYVIDGVRYRGEGSWSKLPAPALPVTDWGTAWLGDGQWIRELGVTVPKQVDGVGRKPAVRIVRPRHWRKTVVRMIAATVAAERPDDNGGWDWTNHLASVASKGAPELPAAPASDFEASTLWELPPRQKYRTPFPAAADAVLPGPKWGSPDWATLRYGPTFLRAAVVIRLRRPDMAKEEASTTISVKKIPTELWHRAKVAAITARQEMGEWLADAIRQKLQRERNKA